VAEKYPSWSPYHYCRNNPFLLIDPDGKYVLDARLKSNSRFMNLMQQVQNIAHKNPKIVKTFEMLNTKVEDFATPGKGPRLVPVPMYAAGFFPTDIGADLNTIKISQHLIDELSKAKSKEAINFYETVLFVTLLHETGHWAWLTKFMKYTKGKGELKRDQPKEPEEMGEWTERQILGQSLEYWGHTKYSPIDREFWRQVWQELESFHNK